MNFAEEHDCSLQEGFVNPCIVDGIDWGEKLYGSFASGWFLLVSIPVAIVLAALLFRLVVTDLIYIFRRRG